MSDKRKSGLGEPVISGKKTLFQSSPALLKPSISSKTLQPNAPGLRTSLFLTEDVLLVIENIRRKHRIQTGRSVPIWKVVCNAVIEYGKTDNKQG